MLQRESLRRAIDELEDSAAASGGPGESVLARLYTTYAQATLSAHGIHVDLAALCDDRRIHAVARAEGPSR